MTSTFQVDSPTLQIVGVLHTHTLIAHYDQTSKETVYFAVCNINNRVLTRLYYPFWSNWDHQQSLLLTIAVFTMTARDFTTLRASAEVSLAFASRFHDFLEEVESPWSDGSTSTSEWWWLIVVVHWWWSDEYWMSFMCRIIRLIMFSNNTASFGGPHECIFWKGRKQRTLYDVKRFGVIVVVKHYIQNNANHSVFWLTTNYRISSKVFFCSSSTCSLGSGGHNPKPHESSFNGL